MVDDQAEVVQLLVAREHGGLPDLALLDLAVTKQAVGAIGIAPVLGGERHAHGSRDALAQGAGGHVDARGIVHVGVALKVAADMAQGLEVLLGEEATLGEGRIQRGSAVALGEHEAVAVGATRVCRIDVHLLEVEVGDDVGGAERTTGVPGLRCVRADHDPPPDLIGNLDEFLIAHGRCLLVGERCINVRDNHSGTIGEQGARRR